MNAFDIVRLRPALAPALGFGAQLLLWGKPGAHVSMWPLTLAVSAVLLWVWISSYRRYRELAATPISPLRSAAQGYVGLQGIGRSLPGVPLPAPHTGLPCLWYRIREEYRENRKDWRLERDESSDFSFVLEDGEGRQCTIDPQGARIDGALRDDYREADYRRTVWMLVPGMRLTAFGHFQSARPLEGRGTLAEEVRDRLADWKSSGQARQRFDADGNGALDMAEWEQVRAAAQKEVEQERAATAGLPASHELRCPADGRPFTVSSRDPARLLRRLRMEAALAALCFFATLITSAAVAVHAA